MKENWIQVGCIPRIYLDRKWTVRGRTGDSTLIYHRYWSMRKWSIVDWILVRPTTRKYWLSDNDELWVTIRPAYLSVQFKKELNWNANFGNRESPWPSRHLFARRAKDKSVSSRSDKRNSQSNNGWERRPKVGLAEGHFKLCTKTDFCSSARLWGKSN